jgi:multidrug resistance efflux pump
MAQGEIYQIAATCTGRLQTLSVRPFERVVAGQTLALLNTVLDNEPVKAQLVTLQAEIDSLSAQLVSLKEDYSAQEMDRNLDYVTEQRRFEADIEDTRLRILETNAVLASDKILLGDLQMELKIAQKLLEQKAVKPYDVEKAQLQYDTLAAKLIENEHLLEQAKADLKDNLKRYDDYQQQKPYHPSVDHALHVIRQAIKVQEGLMGELQARLKPLELTSPITGIVIPIQGNSNEVDLRRPGENLIRRPGEVLNAGDSVCSVVEIEPREIAVYVEEGQLSQVHEGSSVELMKTTQPAQIAQSQVIHVSPVMERLPERLWINPTMPQWGRMVLIGIPPGFRLTSGETVRVRGL